MMTLRRMTIALFTAVASLAPLACHRPAHTEAKAEARLRWSEARGRVKLQLARQQFNRGQFTDSVKTLEEALSLDPSCAEAYALLAKSNLELGKPATAEHLVDAAWQLDLDAPDLHYLKGVLLEQREQFAPALAEYEKARLADDGNVDYFIAAVECMVALDRAAEALKLLDENVERFDDQSSVAILGARIAALLGDTDDAMRRYQNPAITAAQSPLAAQELGLLLARAGKCSEALRVLSPALDNSTSSTADTGALRRSMASCHLALGEPALARAVLLDYAREHLDDVPAQVLLAKAALSTGDFLTALRAIDLARRPTPNDHDTGLLLATIHWRRGDLQSAESVLNDLLAADPYDVDAWCLLGEVQSSTNRPGEAREAFERALAIDPESRWGAAGLGVTERP